MAEDLIMLAQELIVLMKKHDKATQQIDLLDDRLQMLTSARNPSMLIRRSVLEDTKQTFTCYRDHVGKTIDDIIRCLSDDEMPAETEMISNFDDEDTTDDDMLMDWGWAARE
jgi:acyl CoA:acetate/3-ketoacid CoA transferase beta subunit